MIDKEEVKRIALLARMGIKDNELEKFQNQLSNILSNFNILQEVDTSDLPATAQTISLTNVFREDKYLPMLRSAKKIILKFKPFWNNNGSNFIKRYFNCTYTTGNKKNIFT